MSDYSDAEFPLPLWPVSRLAEAVETLSLKAGILSAPAEAAPPSDHPEPADTAAVDDLITFVSDRLHIECEPVESPCSEIEQMLQNAGPTLFSIPGKDHPRLLLLLRGGRRKLSVIAPDTSVQRVPAENVRNALTDEMEAPIRESVDRLLIKAGVAEERRYSVRKAIINEQLSDSRISGCWLLRLPPDASIPKQFRHARLFRYLMALILFYVISQIIMIFTWWIAAKGMFGGSFEWIWLLAWALILFTNIPFNLAGMRIRTLLSVGSGVIFKKRFLYGSMQLEPEEIRHQGVGQFLSRVMESETLDAMVLESGFISVFAVVELFTAISVLSMGAGGWPHALLLPAWMLIIFFICWQYYRYNSQWIENYREMTNDLVERMVGHRTRLAHEDIDHWHEQEDQYLDRYLKLSEKMDRIEIRLEAFIARGWMIMGLAGIAYLFVAGPVSRAKLAVSLGGIMLAGQALGSFVAGFSSFVGIKTSWDQAGPLFRAAARSQKASSVFFRSEDTGETEGQPLLLARDIVFRYRDRGRPVLQDCNLKIYPRDRLLLEGPSGGGKSTLASLLAGLRQSESGLLLLRGFDWQTIGLNEWRKRVVSAPQFHENHVFTETFSFNLLMGRRWPPLPEDLEEAEIICRELGLGDLLERMPAGFQQMVGESGWQLSHGERSRLYIARALLQHSDIIILDESFAALDPENLHLSLCCVLRRAPALVVIAHP